MTVAPRCALCTNKFRVQTSSCNIMCENVNGHHKCLRSVQRYRAHIATREGQWSELIEAIISENDGERIDMLSQFVLLETLTACPILQPQAAFGRLPHMDLATAAHALATLNNRRLVHAMIVDISRTLISSYSSAPELQQRNSSSQKRPSPPRRPKGRRR